MRAMSDLPLDEQVAELRRPEVRRQLLDEEPTVANLIARRS